MLFLTRSGGGSKVHPPTGKVAFGSHITTCSTGGASALRPLPHRAPGNHLANESGVARTSWSVWSDHGQERTHSHETFPHSHPRGARTAADRWGRRAGGNP